MAHLPEEDLTSLSPVVRPGRPRALRKPPVPLLALFVATMVGSCADAELPSIDILKDDGIGWDEKEPCTTMYSEEGMGTPLPARIKCRGGMSSKYFKHSFALELDDKHPLCGLPSDDDWVLNASYIDKTFMRHKLCYDLFMEMDSANRAARSAYVKVHLNGAYEGLYVLMQEVNASLLGLDKKDTLAVLFKDPPLFHRERIPPQDTSNYYQQKFPRIGERDQTGQIERFRDFLFHAPDEVFARGIGELIDIRNVIDWHLLLLLTNNSDGIMKNFYLYRTGSSAPFRIAIWDYDHSFGRDGDNEPNMMERELDCDRSVLIERLTTVPGTGYSERLGDRWRALRRSGTISLGNIKDHVARNHRAIRKETERNFAKWPVDGQWYFDDNGYEEEVRLLLRFVELRTAQLDKRFAMPRTGA